MILQISQYSVYLLIDLMKDELKLISAIEKSHSLKNTCILNTWSRLKRPINLAGCCALRGQFASGVVGERLYSCPSIHVCFLIRCCVLPAPGSPTVSIRFPDPLVDYSTPTLSPYITVRKRRKAIIS